LAKVALELGRALAERPPDAPPQTRHVRLGGGAGWAVDDVVCTAGPRDRPFEEVHESFALALVVAGTFSYRCRSGAALMTPGSLFLGDAGDAFECGHEHAAGDRCVSFHFEPETFARLARDAGAARARLDRPRLPPLRALAPPAARAWAGLAASAETPWEEVAFDLAARVLRLAAGEARRAPAAPPNAEARVTRVVRALEGRLDEPLGLGVLAREAGLSPYHFLRTFRAVTGVTPHQYLLRARLREAARRLARGGQRVLDLALDSGFSDLSNFNRAFRAEFGASPRAWRALSVPRAG
jgi:AraC-like DNA-binding protein